MQRIINIHLSTTNANIFIIFASCFIKKTKNKADFSSVLTILHSYSHSLEVTPIMKLVCIQDILYL